MKVLVCGGRTWGEYLRDKPEGITIAQRQFLWYTLSGFEPAITEVIHGGAKGADRMAAKWAYANGVNETCVRADWNTHGRSAGPIRNQEMLDLEPGVVIAFPGGKGTADMVTRARKAGVRVVLPCQSTCAD